MDYVSLVKNLASAPLETSCVEFKGNKNDPEMIGRTASALSNSSLLEGRKEAYMVWGIDDSTHDIVGTTFDPRSQKKGNEDLINWLRQNLSDNFELSFAAVSIDGKNVVVMSVSPPIGSPAAFHKIPYIRIESHVKPLSSNKRIEADVLEKLDQTSLELRPIARGLTAHEVLDVIDCEAFVKGIGVPRPMHTSSAMDLLCSNRVLSKQPDGRYDISFFGALLFSKDLDRFDPLMRKTVRIVQYEGKDRGTIKRQIERRSGYGICFEEVLSDISLMIPATQHIDESGRMVSQTAFPMDAIREILANALIHQDLSDASSYVSVELFDDRIEFTNPGSMLIDPKRLIDSPPMSRNQYLPSMMRRMGLCEEMGSGWDRIIKLCESRNLPAPRVSTYPSSTRVTAFSRIDFPLLSREDRQWACYMHACYMHANGGRMTNPSLRARFGLDSRSAVAISRLLKSCCDKGLIKVFDPDVNHRNQSYVPFWA